MDFAHIGFAVIGCGYWGVNYIRILNEMAETRVVSICDQRTDRLYEIGRRFPGVNATPDLNRALDSAEVDAVVVCTNPTTHFSIASQCIEAGKHVLIEKPMTICSPEAMKLVALAEEKGVKLMVGHTFLYNPGIQKVKDCIDQMGTGRIYYLYSRRTNLGPIRQDVNVVWDLASHDVSIFNYLLGATPKWASAVGAKVLLNHREDVSFITLGYRDGIIGHIHVSWADPQKVRELVVVGSEQRIVFNDLDALDRVRVYQKGVTPAQGEANTFGEFHYLMRDGDIISPRVEVGEPLKNECLSFIRCIQENTYPLTDGKTGVDVVRALEAIDRSIEKRGIPVDVM